MAKPKFSIITPVFNIEPYLRESLDSVMNQFYTDWECICVDDGSTDGSGDILAEYAARDSRFIIVRQKNSGVGAARNAALSVASGEWVVFLDGDDMFHRELLSLCAEAAEQSPECDIVHYGRLDFADGCKPVWQEPLARTPRVTDISREIPDDAMAGEFWTRAYRRQTIAATAFPPYLVGEDWAWLAEVLARAHAIVELNTPLYGYRVRRGSAVHSSMSLFKLQSHVRWRLHVAAVFAETQKEVDPVLSRRAVLSVTETFSTLFFGERDLSLRKAVWTEWLEAVASISKMPITPKWSRMAAKLTQATRSEMVARLLFWLPFWLKSHGIHR